MDTRQKSTVATESTITDQAGAGVPGVQPGSPRQPGPVVIPGATPMPNLEIDPVCMMQIAADAAAASSVIEGQRFLFCCPRCHAAFLDTPHRFVGWAGDPLHALPAGEARPNPEGAAQPPIAPGPAQCSFDA